MAPYTNEDVDKFKTPGIPQRPGEAVIQPAPTLPLMQRTRNNFNAAKRPPLLTGIGDFAKDVGEGMVAPFIDNRTAQAREAKTPPRGTAEAMTPPTAKNYQPDMTLTLPAHDTGTSPGPNGASGMPATAPALPASKAIVSVGKYGEPMMTNQDGFKPVAPGAKPVTLRPAATDTLPSPNPINPGDVTLKRDEGDYNPYTGQKTSLRSMEGTGTVPGGQVIAPTMDAETQKLVEARKAEGSAALDSYNRALDEANIMEGAHGPAQAARARAQIQTLRDQQMKAFTEKYGLDLKNLEFQATLPKIQAEAALAKSQAGYYGRGGPAGATGKFNAREQQWLDISKNLMHQLITPDIYNPRTPEQENEIRDQIKNAHDELDKLAQEKQAKQPAAAKPSRVDFIAKAKQANPGYSDAEIAAEYDKRYGGK